MTARPILDQIRLSRRLEQVVTMAALGLLIIGCFVVLRPFITALLWAAIMCYCTWPLYIRIGLLLGHRPRLAAILMTVLVCLVMVVPFAIVGMSLASNLAPIVKAITEVIRDGLPPPLPWLPDVPVVGDLLTRRWQALLDDPDQTAVFLREAAATSQAWLLKRGVDIGHGVLQLSLSVLISYFFYRDGKAVVGTLTQTVRRLAGDRTKHLVEVVGRTVRGVVYGVLGTALGQGAMAAVGFWIAGVPSPLLLGLVTFFMSVVPVGPPMVWIPAAIWLYLTQDFGWAVFMVAWGVLGISGVDNVLRPYLISRGTKQSFALTLLGVMGGVLAFGFIGFFLGPTLLAVGYSLLHDWGARSLEPLPKPPAVPPAVSVPPGPADAAPSAAPANPGA